MEKDEQTLIKNETKKLKKIFNRIDEERKKIVLTLIKQVAFLSVELDILQDDIINNGAVETYQNGQNQKGKKISSACQTYNNLLKTYNASIKLLLNELPKNDVGNSEIMEFLSK